MPIRFASSNPRRPAQWWFDLDHDATVTLFSYDHRETKAYALVHENGSFMYDGNGLLRTEDWSLALKMARENSTNWIAFLHEHRIVHIAYAEHAFVEGEVILAPHPSACATLARINDGVTPDEAEQRAQAPKRSGAQNRSARRKRAG